MKPMTMNAWQSSGLAFGVALILAGIEWLAIARRWRRLEYVFKPATLVAILVGVWLLTEGPHDAWQARFFLIGLAFSLVGDIFLLLPGRRFFLAGLIAFLLAHLCYIVGLNPSPPPLPSLAFALIIAVIGMALYPRIAAELRRRDQTALLVLVAVYGVVLSLMLFSAWATLFRSDWIFWRRGLVIGGATLFFVSDATLAWDRFVAPSPWGRLRVMITYHLAQLTLAASIALPG